MTEDPEPTNSTSKPAVISMNSDSTRVSGQRDDKPPISAAPKIPPMLNSTPPVMPCCAESPADTSSFGVQLITK